MDRIIKTYKVKNTMYTDYTLTEIDLKKYVKHELEAD